MTSAPEKVVIIGSGIGGLSTAIILAGLGYDVTVLEKNRQPGGLMRSYTRDGIACEVGVHYLGSLGKGEVLRKFFDYLGVTDAISVSRLGACGIVDKYLFDSPDTHPFEFNFPAGFDAYEKNLKEAFPKEHKNIEKIVAAIRKSAEQLHSLDALYSEDGFSLLDQMESYGKMLDNLGCSAGLRSVLAIPASWIGVPVSECPVYYHNMAIASYLSSAWRLEQSGTEMANVLATRLLSLGGTIRTSSEVKAIHESARVVSGVELESGESIPAAIVIAAVHPQVVLKMLPDRAVKPSYRNRISKLKNTHSVFSVHARIDSRTHPEVPYNIFKAKTDAEGNVPDLKYYQFRKSGQDNTTLLSILTSGNDALWAPWKESVTGKRPQKYTATKTKYAMHLLNEAESIFGKFHEFKLLDAYTPLTLRDWTYSPDGSAYGVFRSTGQSLTTALLNRTAVKGLYLAGQNVLAPGVIGTIMGSFSTVKLILGADEFRKNVCL